MSDQFISPGCNLEICVDCYDSGQNAITGGATRIELCSALALGGLTPSTGLLEALYDLNGDNLVKIYCMLRARAGDFNYDSSDVDVMKREARKLLENGADGFVFGALTTDGSIDTATCAALMDIAPKKPWTFHRAFDVCRSANVALETIIDVGFSRILTSGREKTVVEGTHQIAKLVTQAGDRLTILAGGGVNAVNVARLISATRVREVHGSASVLLEPQWSGQLNMGVGCCDGRRITSVENVTALKHAAISAWRKIFDGMA